MVFNRDVIRIGLLSASFLFLAVHGQTSGPYFMVTFPAVIESGSNAKFCVSLLKPNETLQMKIYLVHNRQIRTLLLKKVKKEFHRCSHFTAPQDSVQNIVVEVRGKRFQMTEERKVMFISFDPMFFIQTDKPIYSPGQTVHFRIFSMDSKLIPLKQTYQTVILQDNRKKRIGQWTNVSSTGLILQLSHDLSTEAPLGYYELIAKTGSWVVAKTFTVERFALPKFEVTVQLPMEHNVSEEELTIEVCGKYIYGQPVPGQVVVEVCHEVGSSYINYIKACLSETKKKLGDTGCATLIVNVSSLLETEEKGKLCANVILKEEETDIIVVKHEKVAINLIIGKVEILNLPTTVDKGKVIEGKIKVTTFRGKPVPNKKVYLSDISAWSQKILFNLTTNSDGLATFSVPLPNDTITHMFLRASVYPGFVNTSKNPHFSHAETYIQVLQPAPPYSPGLSTLTIDSLEEPLKCGSEISITIHYIIIGETIESCSIDFIYTTVSKGAIFYYGHEKVEMEESTDVRKGNVKIKMVIVPELSPVIQVVVYSILPSDNVIAVSRNLNVEKCFKNKVSLQYSPLKAVPGERNTLTVSALPGSLCGLSAVDQSVFILKRNIRLDINEIFKLLPVTVVSDYPFTIEDNMKCLNVRTKRDVWVEDTYQILKNIGLKMATNLLYRQPDCLSYKGMQYYSMGVSGTHIGMILPKLRLEENYIPALQIRRLFLETWIWQLIEVGDSGSVQFPVTVPDTITTWETEAFCVSSRGLGMAPPVQLTVFQPFFLELSLPYSIIRGEVFELKATVFNYLSKCIMVKVTPAPSSDYTLEPAFDEEYSSCLCANGRKTFKWTLIPKVLGVLNVTVSAEAEKSQAMCDNEIVSVPERGRIDTVIRSLIVQAEGTEKSNSQRLLLCPKGNSVSEELELILPDGAIEGSARASVSVLGDILGRALKNLDRHLMMPVGCGEINIALLASNIYILQYLQNTDQLTPEIRKKATGFLKQGYQNQLMFKHINGAFSTFRGEDENTWLTAFVLKTFGKAQHYILIDSENIKKAKQWLRNMQNTDGCFIQEGLLYDIRLKGGVNDDVTITAYIAASFLELGITKQDPVVNKSIICLKSSIGNLRDTYTTALLAYTFSLAGENEMRGQLLKELDDVAISADGYLHWNQTASVHSNSLSVEISSYVLLAVLTSSQLSAADLGYANRIVSWLMKQQNANGVFSSIQDTVVGLQALALYFTKVFSSDGSSNVTVKSAHGHSHNFDVNQNNKLVYQEKSLQDAPGKYSIDVKGSTCVSVQATLVYNVPTPTETSKLSITAITDANCRVSFGQTVFLHLTITYNEILYSPMKAIVDIKLLSGFKEEAEAYSSLVQQLAVKDDHLILFIKQLHQNIPVSFMLPIKQVCLVNNLKPALIKVYDINQPYDQYETQYTTPCV